MNDTTWQLCDELGPEKVLYIHQPAIDLKAIVVVDNTAMGPAIGGVRLAEGVTVTECARLARAMTLKNAAANLSHGGGKSVIVGNASVSDDQKEQWLRAFARAIANIQEYIPGPDMGTNERCMAWVRDEIGRAVGLPASIDGIPLDEFGATGFGLVASIAAAEDFCDVHIEGATVAVQGFGSVGQHAARFLCAKGALLVAAADSSGTVSHRAGIDIDELVRHKIETGSVCGYSGSIPLPADAITDIDCDIWIPAARPDVINEGNVHRLKTRMLAEGANIAITPAAERVLEQRGVIVLPDFIANAGGVICGAVEFRHGSRTEAFKLIEEKITSNTAAMFENAAAQRVPLRKAATEMAMARIKEAMSYRRWSK